MNKYINFKTKNLKYILLFSLATQLHAMPYKKDFQIGLGYDINSSKILPSPFQKIEIKTEKIDKKLVEKIVQIKTFEDLFKELDIDFSLSSINYKKIDKLLNDTNINNYTLTYLIHSQISTQKNSLILNEIQDINRCKNYINSLTTGGEFIALIHIKTNSSNDYKKTQRYINKQKLSWDNINTFKAKVQKISDTHIVTVKNIIISDNSLLPSSDISKVINNAQIFKKDIKNHETTYKSDIKTCTKKGSIDNYLKASQMINNLNYIRKHNKQFSQDIKPTILTKQRNQLNNYLLNINRDINEYNKTKLTTILNNITLPQRYQANSNQRVEVPIQNLPSKEIENRYPKILEDKQLAVNYDFKIKIQNSGKVILLTWTKIVSLDNKSIHKEENSKILLDTYINFKNLKASQIVNYNIGTLVYATKFDAYKKSRVIEGDGIIKNANCGYKILKNGELKIECKDIKLKDLDIKFEHEE